jgi:peroxiredoxin
VAYQHETKAIVGVQRCAGTTMGANSHDLDTVEMSCPGIDERSKCMAQNGTDSNESHRRESQPGASSRQALGPGAEAPDFTLHTTPDQTMSLAEFRGRPVVLVFYPADWSPVCSDEMALFNEVLPEFRRLRAELMGISVDGVWCHLAFARERRLQFPLLADFEPKGDVARRYGVYRRQDGTTERALFVIDDDGVIRWSYVSPIGVNPGADGVLTALEELPKRQSAASAKASQASDR